jgi:predicted N-acetyltransferase YhbS
LPLTAPTPLNDSHSLSEFDSGEPALDDWLKRRAKANQASGASRTFVVCDGSRVVGYYALAAGSIAVEDASGRFKRNMPNPIPVVLLARLAVDKAYQGQGIGRALFRDSALRVANAADAIGVRGMVVHAISERARAFYQKLGFDPAPGDAMALMVTLQDLRAALETP